MPPQPPPYWKNVYNALKSKVDGFALTEEQFEQKLSDPTYQQNVYKALKQKVEGFELSEQDFYGRLGKKKDQTGLVPSLPGSPPVSEESTESVEPPAAINPSLSEAQKAPGRLNTESAPLLDRVMGWFTSPPTDQQAAEMQARRPAIAPQQPATYDPATAVGPPAPGQEMLPPPPQPRKPMERNPAKTLAKAAWNTARYQLPADLIGGAIALEKAPEDLNEAAFKPIAQALGDSAEPRQTNIESPKLLDRMMKWFTSEPTPEEALAMSRKEKQEPERIRRRKDMLAQAMSLRAEGQQANDGLVNTLDKAEDWIDYVNWGAAALGNAGVQIPLAIATGGGSAFGQEIGTIYLDGVNKLAEENGITPQEVIEQGKDDSLYPLVFGMGAGALEFLGAKGVTGTFTKSEVMRSMRERALALLKAGGGESLTEGGQSFLEQIGASKAADKSWEQTFKSIDLNDIKESMAQGLVGGTGVNAITESIQNNIAPKPEALVKEPTETIKLKPEPKDKPDEPPVPPAPAAVEEKPEKEEAPPPPETIGKKETFKLADDRGKSEGRRIEIPGLEKMDLAVIQEQKATISSTSDQTQIEQAAAAIQETADQKPQDEPPASSGGAVVVEKPKSLTEVTPEVQRLRDLETQWKELPKTATNKERESLRTELQAARKSTEIPVETVFSKPIEKKYSEESYLSPQVQIELDVSEISPSQETVKQGYVENQDPDYIPTVNKVGDKYVVNEGHHRIADQILKGAKTVRVKIAYDSKEEYEKAKSETKTSVSKKPLDTFQPPAEDPVVEQTQQERAQPAQAEGAVSATEQVKDNDFLKQAVYHASDRKRKGRLVHGKAPQFGTGVYFSTNKDRVQNEFGDEITEAKLNLSNPVYTSTKEWRAVEKLARQKAADDYNQKKNPTEPKSEGDMDFQEIDSQFISDAAKELGHDAIVQKDDGGQYDNEIMVLDESKIVYPEDAKTTEGTAKAEAAPQAAEPKKEVEPELQATVKQILSQRSEVTTEKSEPGKTAEPDYSKWKRQNVSYRGVKEKGKQENNRSGMLGKGLYTAPASNKSMTKEYGDRYFVVNARPKNPKVFNSLNEWEIWFQNQLVFPFSKAKGKEFPDIRDFESQTSIEKELQKRGFDGIEIKGREMVNFAPPDNVKYFKSEDEVKAYHNSLVETSKEQPVKGSKEAQQEDAGESYFTPKETVKAANAMQSTQNLEGKAEETPKPESHGKEGQQKEEVLTEKPGERKPAQESVPQVTIPSVKEGMMDPAKMSKTELSGILSSQKQKGNIGLPFAHYMELSKADLVKTYNKAGIETEAKVKLGEFNPGTKVKSRESNKVYRVGKTKGAQVELIDEADKRTTWNHNSTQFEKYVPEISEEQKAERQEKKDVLTAQPTTIRGAVLQYFANKGRVQSDDFTRETGFGSERKDNRIGGKRGLEEFRKRIWAVAKDAPTVDGIIQIVKERLSGIQDRNIDEGDIRNEIISVLQEHSTPSSIYNELKQGQKEEQGPTEEDFEAQWMAEQERLAEEASMQMTDEQVDEVVDKVVGETLAAKEIRKQLEVAEGELQSAQTALKEKAKELDKTLMADQENLFGERKSTESAGLFDVRADAGQRDVILGPFKVRVEKAKAEVSRLNENLKGEEGKVDMTLFDKEIGEEGRPANALEELLSSGDFTSENLEVLKEELFSGFPFTPRDFELVKEYLTEQENGNRETTQGPPEAGEPGEQSTPEGSAESAPSEESVTGKIHSLRSAEGAERKRIAEEIIAESGQYLLTRQGAITGNDASFTDRTSPEFLDALDDTHSAYLLDKNAKIAETATDYKAIGEKLGVELPLVDGKLVFDDTIDSGVMDAARSLGYDAVRLKNVDGDGSTLQLLNFDKVTHLTGEDFIDGHRTDNNRVSFDRFGTTHYGVIEKTSPDGKAWARADNGTLYKLNADEVSPTGARKQRKTNYTKVPKHLNESNDQIVEYNRKRSKPIGIVANNNLEFMFQTDLGRLFEKTAGWSAEYFTSRGYVPRYTFDRWIQSKGEISKYEYEIKVTIQDFQKAVREEYGRNGISDSQVNDINQVLGGKKSRQQIPPKTLAQIKIMRAQIDNLSQRFIKEGVVAGDLITKLQNNMGIYLNRSYRKHDDPSWAEFVPDQTKNTALAFLRGKYPQYNDQEIQGLMNYLINSKNAPMSILKGSKLGSMDLSVLKKKGEFAPEIRALMGEYADPLVNYARSVTKMANLIARHHFLQDVKREGLGKYLFEQQTGDYYVQIAAKGSKTMEPLNGLYTTPEIAAAFETFGSAPAMSEGLRYYMKINGYIKAGKTVFSIQTHARNLLGNMGFVMMNWHWDVSKAGMARQIAWANLYSDDQAIRDKFKKYIELGIVRDSSAGGELRQYLEDIKDGKEFFERVQESRLSRFKTGVIEGAQNLYQFEDDVFKIYAFENEKARYQKAFPNKTEDEINQMVATIVRDTYPTYSMVPKIVKGFRANPFTGTFVNFPAEVIRTAYNSLELGIRETRTKETRAIGAKRLAGWMMAMAIPTTISLATRAFLGMDGEDDDDLRKFMAPWQKNSEFIYLDHTGHNIKILDMGYSDPHNYLKRPFYAMMKGESVVGAATLGAIEILKPFLDEEMVFAVIIDVTRNQKKNGDQVYNPDSSPGTIAADIYSHVESVTQIGTIKSVQRIVKGAQGKTDKYGNKYDLGTELTSTIFGQRKETKDIAQSLLFKAYEIKDRIAETKKRYNRVRFNKEATDKEKQIAKEEYDTATENIINDGEGLYLSAIHLGVNPREALITMRKVSSRELMIRITGDKNAQADDE